MSSISFRSNSAGLARRRSLSLTAATFALAGLAGSLSATAQAAGASSCPAVALSQPFLRYGDANLYSIVPGGTFEGGVAGWSLLGGAKVAPGSETAAVTGSLGAFSLLLPQGATAQSPFVCVSAIDRSYRFFARSEGAGASSLSAQVVFQTPLGPLAVPVGKVSASSAWNPSQMLHTGAAIATTISGETVQVAFRFVATAGVSRVDDVFLDPRMRR